MFGARSLSLIAAVTSLAAGAVATQCQGKTFLWSGLGIDICLPTGGISAAPSPRSGFSCPDNWYWHTDRDCCVPKTQRASNSISCGTGWTWAPKKSCCKTSCKRTEFWFFDLEICLPNGGISNPPAPPRGSSCPRGWYWHKLGNRCVPKNKDYDDEPDCDNDFWSLSAGCCKSGRPTCNSRTEFYWPERNICIPKGGPGGPPSPPGGVQCPNTWFWHTGKKCCAPKHDNPPAPTCPGGWKWKPKPCTCEHTPEPTGRISNPKKRRDTELTLCPLGTEACPIAGLFGGEYECLNTMVELESCGGCASTHKGQDCTTIAHAWNVGCERGACRVYSCQHGFSANTNGTSCVPI
ncbi:hypothetical protein BKA62DRAFT_505848 [Auriculariales sp. MPI-PUGE-AT-0066]|nr:hypothetical protein BKA62DRAFT_505848 [Auriculariales sp. MPI-PUGE-AT-0066]